MPTAIITSYEKDVRLERLVRKLHEHGYVLLSSTGTKKFIEGLGIPVEDVADYTGEPPRLDHRVVTIHPKVAGGFLARDTAAHRSELADMGARWFDFVYVNLYPVQKEIEHPGASDESIRDLTDIGGPLLMSAAAKGRRIVLCDPNDIDPFIKWIDSGCPDRENYVRQLAAKADMVIASYRGITARYHSDGRYDFVAGERIRTCKYGENAWQSPAALFTTHTDDPLGLDKFELVAGEEPSYNNLIDVDRMLQTVTHIAAVFDLHLKAVPKMAVAVKHGNPCGAAVGDDPAEVLRKTVVGDKRAIFGGLVMTNFAVDEELAEVLLTYESAASRRLLDGVVAASFTEGSIEMLRRKGDKCRFLANPALSSLDQNSLDSSLRRRQVRGGYLMQPNYTLVLRLPEQGSLWGILTTNDRLRELLLAWAVGSTSNSNTITLVKDGMLIGNGVGQQDRVGCCELAVKRARDAGHDVRGATAYSDSFFPFPDGPEVLANAGVRAILASEGSVNDKLTGQLCKARGVELFMVRDKEARGFFGH